MAKPRKTLSWLSSKDAARLAKFPIEENWRITSKATCRTGNGSKSGPLFLPIYPKEVHYKKP